MTYKELPVNSFFQLHHVKTKPIWKKLSNSRAICYWTSAEYVLCPKEYNDQNNYPSLPVKQISAKEAHKIMKNMEKCS